MKKTAKIIGLQLSFFSLFLLSGIYAFAQDTNASNTSSYHSTTTSSSGPAASTTVWYTAPWVWVVGVVVLILILVALFSGKNNSKTEVIRTTKTTTEVKND